jgi:hypothetical protein
MVICKPHATSYQDAGVTFLKTATNSDIMEIMNETLVFPITITKPSFWPHYGPGVDSASNRIEYQEYFPGA